jgi:zinc-binding alcohol dehydrogenase family protein
MEDIRHAGAESHRQSRDGAEGTGMRAIGYKMAGEAEVLTDIEIPRPVPEAHDLLVRVQAISVNPVDTKRRRWEMPETAPDFMLLGYDAAGIVEAVGRDVELFNVGDEVFYAGAMDRPGTNAELHLVDECIVGPKPKSLSFGEAAAMPLTSITAWEVLFDRMKIPRDPTAALGTLLILNGAGGVGSMMIQLATRLTGLDVIASASRPETAAWVRELGAMYVADHRRPIGNAIRAIGFDGVDYIAAITTTPGIAIGLADAINPQGHITLIDNFDDSIMPFKAKSVTISWEMMFTRSLFQTFDMQAQHRLLRDVSALVDSGVLRSTLTQNLGRITAQNLRRAHQIVETGHAIGKVVLEGF